MKRRHRAVVCAGVFFIQCFSVAVAGAVEVPNVKQPPVASPVRILFVGNSLLYYNDGLQFHVRRLVLAANPDIARSLEYKSATISGAPLAQHDIQHLLRPGALGVKQPFDVVVLQENPTAPMIDSQRTRFRATVTEFNLEIVKRGAKAALYMTHAHVKPNRFADSDMNRRVEEMYVSVGNELGLFVIPVGLAFEEAYRQRPDIKLHKAYDGLHPDLTGTYLAACVVYASLYGASPVGNPYDAFGKIDRDTIAFLQRVADDAVRKFFGR